MMTMVMILMFDALLAAAHAASSLAECPLFLAPSLVKGGGKGIFVGKKVKKGRYLADSIGLIVDDYLVQDLQLMDYVFESHYDRHSTVFFGPALMLNHAPVSKSSVTKKWNRGVVPSLDSVALRHFTNYPGISFQAQSTLKAGSEVTFTYGDEAYFAERGVPFNFVADDGDGKSNSELPAYDIETLRKVGHCLTDISVNKSKISGAGKGAFSNKPFSEGNTVSISPALVVPKHVLEKGGRSSVLINFCFSDEETDLAVLPVGTAAMINHDHRPNVGVRWYDWDGKGSGDAANLLSSNLSALMHAPAAPLYLEYYALRDIPENEELYMDYGHPWSFAWEIYNDMCNSLREGNKTVNPILAPQFRKPITIPAGMFPEKVYQVSCFGTRDCEKSYLQRQPKYFNKALNSNKTSKCFHIDPPTLNEATLNKSVASVEVLVETESTTNSFPVEDCGLYLAPALDGVGMGIFSGAKAVRGDILDISPSVLVSSQSLSVLKHIGAPAMREHYFSVLFGPAAAARSSSLSNMDRTYDAKDRLRSIPPPQAQALRPFNIHTNMLYYAYSDVEEGEEVTIYSGVPQSASEPTREKYNLNELKEKGHCLTNIYVEKSKFPMAGRGVHSKKPYDAGEVVSISPAYIVPKHVLEDDSTSVLINFCVSAPATDVCVLPVGLATMMNHGSEPNVGVRWQKAVSGDMDSADKLLLRLNKLLNGEALYLEYFSIRPISANEELLIDYGSDWVTAWIEYLDMLKLWFDINGDDADLMNAPQFRHFISIEPSLFPDAILKMSSCLGPLGCSGPSKLKRPPRIDSQLNRENHTRGPFVTFLEKETDHLANSTTSTDDSSWVATLKSNLLTWL